MEFTGRKQDMGMDWWERDGCMSLGRDAVEHECNQDVGPNVVGMRSTMDATRIWAWERDASGCGHGCGPESGTECSRAWTK